MSSMKPVSNGPAPLSQLPVENKNKTHSWGEKNVRILSGIPFASTYVAFKVLFSKPPKLASHDHTFEYVNSFSTGEAIVLGIPFFGNIYAYFKIVRQNTQEGLLKALSNGQLTRGFKDKEVQQALQSLIIEEKPWIPDVRTDGISISTANILKNPENPLSKEKKIHFVKNLIESIKNADPSSDTPETTDPLVRWLEKQSDLGKHEIIKLLIDSNWQNIDSLDLNTRWKHASWQDMQPVEGGQPQALPGERNETQALRYLAKASPSNSGLSIGFERKSKKILDRLDKKRLVVSSTFIERFRAATANPSEGKTVASNFFAKESETVAQSFLRSSPALSSSLQPQEAWNRIWFASTLLQQGKNLSVESTLGLLKQVAKDFKAIENTTSPSVEDLHLITTVLMAFNKLDKESLKQAGKETRENLSTLFDSAVTFVDTATNRIQLSADDQRMLGNGNQMGIASLIREKLFGSSKIKEQPIEEPAAKLSAKEPPKIQETTEDTTQNVKKFKFGDRLKGAFKKQPLTEEQRLAAQPSEPKSGLAQKLKLATKGVSDKLEAGVEGLSASTKESADKFRDKVGAPRYPAKELKENQTKFMIDHNEFIKWLGNSTNSNAMDNAMDTDASVQVEVRKMLDQLPLAMRQQWIRDVLPTVIEKQKSKKDMLTFFESIYNTQGSQTLAEWALEACPQALDGMNYGDLWRLYQAKEKREDPVRFAKTLLQIHGNTGLDHLPSQEPGFLQLARHENPLEDPKELSMWNTLEPLEQEAFTELYEKAKNPDKTTISPANSALAGLSGVAGVAALKMAAIEEDTPLSQLEEDIQIHLATLQQNLATLETAESVNRDDLDPFIVASTLELLESDLESDKYLQDAIYEGLKKASSDHVVAGSLTEEEAIQFNNNLKKTQPPAKDSDDYEKTQTTAKGSADYEEAMGKVFEFISNHPAVFADSLNHVKLEFIEDLRDEFNLKEISYSIMLNWLPILKEPIEAFDANNKESLAALHTLKSQLDELKTQLDEQITMEANRAPKKKNKTDPDPEPTAKQLKLIEEQTKLIELQTKITATEKLLADRAVKNKVIGDWVESEGKPRAFEVKRGLTQAERLALTETYLSEGSSFLKKLYNFELLIEKEAEEALELSQQPDSEKFLDAFVEQFISRMDERRAAITKERKPIDLKLSSAEKSQKEEEDQGEDSAELASLLSGFKANVTQNTAKHEEIVSLRSKLNRLEQEEAALKSFKSRFLDIGERFVKEQDKDAVSNDFKELLRAYWSTKPQEFWPDKTVEPSAPETLTQAPENKNKKFKLPPLGFGKKTPNVQ